MMDFTDPPCFQEDLIVARASLGTCAFGAPARGSPKGARPRAWFLAALSLPRREAPPLPSGRLLAPRATSCRTAQNQRSCDYPLAARIVSRPKGGRRSAPREPAAIAQERDARGRRYWGRRPSSGSAPVPNSRRPFSSAVSRSETASASARVVTAETSISDAHLLRQVLEVGLVVLRNEDPRDARPHGAEDLFLEAADREHAARDRDLARHREVVLHGAPGQGRHDGGSHRDAGRGPVLRDGPGGNVDVHVALEVLLVDAEPRRVRPGEGPRRARRFLHHVAELSGQNQLALAAHERRLDEHDVAAGRRVVHAGRDADLVLAGHLLGMHARAAEQRPHVLAAHRLALDLAGRDPARDLARELAELALELPDAGLPRVARHDLADGVVGQRDLAGREAVLLDLARHEVALRDLELFRLGVSGEVHDLHPVEQRARDVLDEVGGCDEEDLREVERHAEVVIREAVVLRGVEDLEQRRRRVALVGNAELVHLVEEEHGVLRAGLLHALEDAARHRADVRAPVAADVGLVARAAERDADVLAPHGAGDGFRDRGLADARGAGEKEDAALATARLLRLFGGVRLVRLRIGRSLALRVLAGVRELAHGQKLEDAVLDVLEAVVVLVQDARGLGHVELLVGALVPRQLRDRLEIRADHLRFHGLAADPGEPLPFAVYFLARVLGKVERVELGAQLLQPVVGRPFALAELLLDRLHLLAQVHLALAAADLFLDLGLDVLLRRQDVHLALHVHEHAAQAVLDRKRLEQDLLLGDRDVEVPGDEVGQAAGLVHLGEDLVHRLFGEAQLLAELGRALPRLAVEAREGRVLHVERQHLLGVLDRGLEVAVLRREAQGDSARLALEHEPDPADAALDGAERGDRADRVEIRGGDVLGFMALGHGEDEAFGSAHGRLDGAQGPRASRRDRESDSGKENGVPHRNHR